MNTEESLYTVLVVKQDGEVTGHKFYLCSQFINTFTYNSSFKQNNKLHRREILDVESLCTLIQLSTILGVHKKI